MVVVQAGQQRAAGGVDDDVGARRRHRPTWVTAPPAQRTSTRRPATSASRISSVGAVGQASTGTSAIAAAISASGSS